MSESDCPSQACSEVKEFQITNQDCPESRKDLPPSVIGEVATSAAAIPVVTRDLSLADLMGRWKARWGIGRMNFTVAPGLYAVGQPDAGSEVLVTANYRMTFDLLRSSLGDLNAWILVLDTKGINVWCAAGKGVFGTEEMVRRVGSSNLESVVNHRRLIVPQLGAPGVAAHEVREKTGFTVMYGPVELKDIPAYIQNGRRATPAMRMKKFPFVGRAAIVPMELIPAGKWVIFITAAVTLISGVFGRNSFSQDALHYGSRSLLALTLGTAAGAVVAPLLLPWLPGRAFALKGAITGAAAAFMFPLIVMTGRLELLAWTLVTIALSSFLAMNFTGSSTYTSLSGVKKEMREAVPFQITAVSIGLVLWLTSLFTGGGGTL